MTKKNHIIAFALTLSLLFCSSIPSAFAEGTAGTASPEPGGIGIMPSSSMAVVVAIDVTNMNELYELIRVSYTIEGETTYITATLEWQINGRWETYKSTTRTGTTNPYAYAYTSKPIKGYYYRLKADISSTTYSPTTIYSNTVFY